MRRRDFIKVIAGSAATWPLATRAQQSRLVGGFLSANGVNTNPPTTEAFRAGLKENGFTDGENVTIEYRWADGRLERPPSMAMDLVRHQVAVIFTAGGSVSAMVAKGATRTIPIVFATGADPVRSGLVASLNRPEGNATGVSNIVDLLGAKHIALLRELAPGVHNLGMIVSPDNPEQESQTADLKAAVHAIGQQITVLHATDGEEIDKAFATLGQLKLDGLVVAPDAVFQRRRDQFVALAAQYAVPTIYYAREFVDAGGLVSYGTSFTWVYHQSAVYVARILKGEKPTDLPVMQPTKFELVINTKTATTLGLTVPQTLRATADELIE